MNINLNKIDKVILNDKQIEHINQWVRKGKFKTLDIPLDEVFFIIEDVPHIKDKNNMGIHFKMNQDEHINEYIAEVNIYDMKDMFNIASIKIDEEFIKTGQFNFKSNLKTKLNEDYTQKIAFHTVMIIFDTFQYMTNKSEHVIPSRHSVKIRKPLNPKSKSKNKTSHHTKITITKYIFDFKNKKSDFTRHALSWNVRGHWRYYKTGKRTWIKSYKKGIGEAEGKIYKI